MKHSLKRNKNNDSLNNESRQVLVRPAGNRYVTVFVDVARALAAQLQCDRREVFSSCSHDDFSHCTIASVENVIESLLQQLLGLWYPTSYHWVELLTHRGQKMIQSNCSFKHCLWYRRRNYPANLLS